MEKARAGVREDMAAGHPAAGGSQELHLFDYPAVYRAAPLERIELIKEGVSAAEVVQFAERLDTSKELLMRWLGLPRATIDRKAKARQNLSTEQSERVLGLAKLIGQVQTMVQESGDPDGFDAARWVGQWLERPNPALGGCRPAQFMDTVEGQQLVSALLAKTQSGAYA